MPRATAPKETDKYMCVRIKRYNPKRGFRKQRFTVFGMKFVEENNWYKVRTSVVFDGEKRDLKTYLENVLQDDDDPDSEYVFDVVSEAEAERINKREEEAERRKHYNLRTNRPTDMTTSRRKRSANEAGDLTTEDVNGKPSRRKFPRSKLRTDDDSTASE